MHGFCCCDACPPLQFLLGNAGDLYKPHPHRPCEFWRHARGCWFAPPNSALCLPSFCSALEFEDLQQLQLYRDPKGGAAADAPHRRLLLGISGSGRVALWDFDRWAWGG